MKKENLVITADWICNELILTLYDCIFCSKYFKSLTVIQLAGAVEYTNCSSAKGTTPTNECPAYDIKLHLIVRFQSSNLRHVEYLFIAISPKSTLTRRGSTC